jgi:hypothetical protein
MVSGSMSPETLLTSPVPCWHESLYAARTDVIVRLSARRALLATARPVPVGTLVFLELGHDAGIDGIVVANDADTFLVEFITVDTGAAAVIASALQTTARSAIGGSSSRRTPLTFPAASGPSEPDDRVSDAAPPLTRPQAVVAPDGFVGDPNDPWISAARRSAATPPLHDGARGPSWARALDTHLGEEPDIPDSGHTQRWPIAHAAELAARTPEPRSGLPWPAAAFQADRALTVRPTDDVVGGPRDAHRTTTPALSGPHGPWDDGSAHHPVDLKVPSVVGPGAQGASMPGASLHVPSVATAERRADPWDVLPPTVSLGFDDSEVATTRWPSAHVARAKTPPSTTMEAAWPLPAPVSAWLDLPTTQQSPALQPTAVQPSTDTPHGSSAAPATPASPTWTTPGVPPPVAVTEPTATSRSSEPGGVIEVDFSEFRDVLGAATPTAADTGWHASGPPGPPAPWPPRAEERAFASEPRTMAPRSVDELWFVAVPREMAPTTATTTEEREGDATIASSSLAPPSTTPPRIALEEEDIVTAPGGTAQLQPTPRTEEQGFDEGEDVSLDD